MEIREIGAPERSSVSLSIQAHAFQSTPASDELVQALERRQRFYEGNLMLVAEEDRDLLPGSRRPDGPGAQPDVTRRR